MSDFTRPLGTILSVAALIPGPQQPFVAGAALAVNLYNGQQARAAAQRAQRRAAAEAARGRAVTGNVSGGDEAHNLIFGTARVGGVLLNTSTSGVNNVVLHLFLAHSVSHAGGIEGVTALYINENKLPTTVDGLVTLNGGTGNETRYQASRPSSGDALGMVEVRTYLGRHTQVIGSDITSIGIATATDHAKGSAWSWVRLTRDLNNDAAFQRAFNGGIPQVSLELRGLKCYDPRLDSTRGGSGGHRANDALTWAYTENPACIAITYLLMRQLDGGCGVPLDEIDYASFAAAASNCDPALAGSSPAVARYRFNGVLSTADGCDVNLDRIVATMAGDWWQEGGRYRVRAGVYQSPTATITDNWLSGGVSITNGSGLDGLYNAVRPVFKSPADNYSEKEAFPFTNAGYVAEDGGLTLYRDLALPCVTNHFQAQYLAQVEGRRSRHQRRVTLPLNLVGLTLEIGQAVQLDLSPVSEIGGANVYVVESKDYAITEQGGLQVVVSLLEDRLDSYAVGTFGAPSASPAYPLIYETPQAPFAFSATGVADGINLLWRSPPAATHIAVEIEVAASAGGPYSLLGRLKGDAAVYGDTSGATTFFRLRAVNAQGQFSAYSSVVSAAAKTVQNGATVGARFGSNLFVGGTLVSSMEEVPDGGSRLAQRRFFFPQPSAGTGGWMFLGRWTYSASPSSLLLLIQAGTGYNAASNQQSTTRLVARGANDAGAPNFSGLTWYTDGVPVISGAKAVAAGGSTASNNRAWDIYVNTTAFAGGLYSVDLVPGDAWLPSGAAASDPGPASNTVVVGQGNAITDQFAQFDWARALVLNRSLDFVSDSVVYSRIRSGELSNGNHLIGIAGSGYRCGDQRNVPAIATANLRSRCVGQTITANYNTSTPATVTFSVSAASLRIGNISIAYSATSTTRTQNRNTTAVYYLYVDDIGLSGGPTVLQVTTDPLAIYQNDGRVYVGDVTVTVPAAATGGGGGGNPGGGSCVAVEMLTPDGRCFEELSEGDALLLCDYITGVETTGEIERLGRVSRACCLLSTANGAQLVCSLSAPIAVRGGGPVLAANLRTGDLVATRINGVFEWAELTDNTLVGERAVRPVQVGNRYFWAGVTAGASILHHNKLIP